MQNWHLNWTQCCYFSKMMTIRIQLIVWFFRNCNIRLENLRIVWSSRCLLSVIFYHRLKEKQSDEPQICMFKLISLDKSLKLIHSKSKNHQYNWWQGHTNCYPPWLNILRNTALNDRCDSISYVTESIWGWSKRLTPPGSTAWGHFSGKQTAKFW